jgi:outer membrane protein
LALADAHRQDLLAARLQVKAAAERLQATWGEYFPSISLNLTRYLKRESFPDDVDWIGLIKVNLPIFSAGLIHADVRTAYSRLRQAHLADTALRRRVLRELRVATEDLHGVRLQVDALRVRVAAAKEAVRQADAAYSAGLGTNLERLIAQDQLLSAQLALTEKQFGHIVDYLRVMRTVGMLDVRLTPLPPLIGGGESAGRDASLGAKTEVPEAFLAPGGEAMTTDPVTTPSK